MVMLVYHMVGGSLDVFGAYWLVTLGLLGGDGPSDAVIMMTPGISKILYFVASKS